jgi:TonB-like protein
MNTIRAPMSVFSDRRPFALAIALSALVHLLGFLLLPLPAGGARPTIEPPLEVALLPPEPPPRPAGPAPRQMVAPPDTINDQPPERPHFESDRDNTVEHETVNPGVPNPGPEAEPAPGAKSAARTAPSVPDRPPPAPQPKAAQRPAPPPRPAVAEAKHAPALDDLFASRDELVKAQRAAPEQAEDGQESSTGKRRLALAVPPVTPEWSLPGLRGTLDNLPDIQRGSVTLLNTKANVFSPFVRRVGERVFQHLIIRQRRLELQQIMTAQHPVQMRVTLDPHGRLKSVQIEGQSGSATMDDTLSDALNTAAFDNNPPPAAANANGEFEFVFQAQLRAFQPGPGGAGGRIESRLSVALL